MTVVDDTFFFFAAVILTAPSVSVSNSIVKLLHKLADLLKLPDLLILIFMKIASFSASQPVLRLSSSRGKRKREKNALWQGEDMRGHPRSPLFGLTRPTSTPPLTTLQCAPCPPSVSFSSDLSLK
jgi:hypothetical protein